MASISIDMQSSTFVTQLWLRSDLALLSLRKMIRLVPNDQSVLVEYLDHTQVIEVSFSLVQPSPLQLGHCEDRSLAVKEINGTLYCP